MKKVVGLGACVLDTLINCCEYPKEDTKLKSNGVFLAGGGPVGNALVIMSKLGVSAYVLGALADDNAGDYLVEDFKKYNVSTDYIYREKNTSSFTSYILLNEKNNTRTCVFDRGSVSDEPNNVELKAIRNADVLHLDGNYLESAIYAAKYAKENGVKVSLDAGGIYSGIERLLPYIDILIPSKEFAIGITNETDIPSAMLVLLQKYHPEILVVTDGKDGGYYWDGRTAVKYDGVKVDAVDTNGAGDTFHGAFIVAYCEGKSVKECCAFASKVAAYKCTQKGVRTFEINDDILINYFK